MWNFVFRLARKFKPGLVSAFPALLLTLFVLVNVAIWWAGPWLNIAGDFPLAPLMARAIASALFSLLCLAVWGMWQSQKLKNLQKEQAHALAVKQDPIRVLELNQEKELDAMMLEMKTSINRGNYLYALPWYLVLGLENSGKTSLINRSGQNFIFSSVLKASGRRSENPYTFDWWVGDNSVLIDPDGELLTQGQKTQEEGEMERRLWVNFVKWLENTRNRRPLNGVILTVDISHIATATTAERKAYANILRARLRELMETLSSQMPVYIALTKLDLLYGFEPYFKSLSKAEKEQAFGFTFSLNSSGQNLDKWLDEFAEQYSEFVDRVNDSIPERVLDGLSLEDRNAVYSFSRQVAGLQRVLHQFFDDALSSDQFSTSALVRGTYFTSVYQQGVPTNAFDDAASRRYGLSHAINRAQKASNSTIYFTKRLFQDVIYPEAGLASDNFRASRRKRRALALSMLTCSVATALLGLGWHKHYELNMTRADEVLERVNLYTQDFPNSLRSETQADILESLNQIRNATLAFGVFRETPKHISDMGLYQGHDIGPKVEETYLSLLRSKFLPMLMADVIVDMENAQFSEERLAKLRVYRMMTDSSGGYPEYVKNYYGKLWQQNFAGQKRQQGQLMEHLEYALAHISLEGERQAGHEVSSRVLAPYDWTIRQAQTELGQLPTAERVYRNIKADAESTLGADTTLRTLVGPVFDVVFEFTGETDFETLIPRLMTKDGYHKYFSPKTESVTELALIDSWVLGQVAENKFTEADKQQLKREIRDLYASDYVNVWQDAIEQIDVKYFANIQDGVSLLDKLTSNLQPMQKLLLTLHEHTRFMSALNSEADEEVTQSPKYELASKISSPFSDLTQLVHNEGGAASDVSELLGSIEALEGYLRSIGEAPDVGMAALDATKSRMKLVNADPIYTIQRVASGLPKPLDRIVNKLADESWIAVKREAIEHLEVKWYEDVYQPFYAKFATRYPFKKSAKNDVSLDDFEAFFAPNGTLDNFYRSQLKVFIEERNAAGVIGEKEALIRADVLDQIEQAQRIRSAFFNRKGILDVNFAVEPLYLSGNKRRAVLNVDGQFVEYAHGPRESVELIWPNTLRDSAVSKVTLVPTKRNVSPRSVHNQGPWALFRLLEKGAVVSASNTFVDYKFEVDGGDMVYRLHSEADANPFTDRLFKSFKLSRTLY